MKIRMKIIYGGQSIDILTNPDNPTYGYEGRTPLEIVKSMMRDEVYFSQRDGWVFGYLDRTSKYLQKLGLRVSFSGKTETEMAESFLNSCRDAKLLTVIE